MDPSQRFPVMERIFLLGFELRESGLGVIRPPTVCLPHGHAGSGSGVRDLEWTWPECSAGKPSPLETTVPSASSPPRGTAAPAPGRSQTAGLPVQFSPLTSPRGSGVPGSLRRRAGGKWKGRSCAGQERRGCPRRSAPCVPGSASTAGRHFQRALDC